jgi:hypothetical protein
MGPMARDALLREGPRTALADRSVWGTPNKTQLPTVMIGRLPPTCNSRHLHSGALHEYPLPNVPRGLPARLEADANFRRPLFRKERIAAHRSVEVAPRPDRSLCVVSVVPRAPARACECWEGTYALSDGEGPAPERKPGKATRTYSPRASEASSHSSSRVSFSSARSFSCLFCSASASKSDFSVLLTMSSWSFFSC